MRDTEMKTGGRKEGIGFAVDCLSHLSKVKEEETWFTFLHSSKSSRTEFENKSWAIAHFYNHWENGQKKGLQHLSSLT